MYVSANHRYNDTILYAACFFSFNFEFYLIKAALVVWLGLCTRAICQGRGKDGDLAQMISPHNSCRILLFWGLLKNEVTSHLEIL